MVYVCSCIGYNEYIFSYTEITSTACTYNILFSLTLKYLRIPSHKEYSQLYTFEFPTSFRFQIRISIFSMKVEWIIT